jgi:hypothetical protein
MRFTALLLLALCGAILWIAILVATDFSGPAVGAGMLGALVLQSRAS